MLIIRYFLISLMLFFSSGAQASTLTDLGDETRDTATNLAWLDLSKTNGLSVNQALLNFSSYRLASNSEVYGLFTNAGLVVPSSLASGYETQSQNLIELLGPTFGTSTTPSMGFQGWSRSDFGTNQINDPFVARVNASGRVTVYSGLGSVGDFDRSVNNVGVFLVREVPTVPVPASGLLLGFVVSGAVLLSRRKRVS